MANNSNKQVANGKKRDEVASIVAGICKVSDRQVRRVINGESENDLVMEVYMTYMEGKNELIQKVKELVPFN